MDNSKFVELVLTCGSWQEAQKIADYLLENRLVACVEFMEIKSKYWWEGKLSDAKEIKLVMQTLADRFDKIEAEVAKLHSHKTFVLQALPLTHISQDAAQWLVGEVDE